ncbi:hypothetical protein [Brevibacillus borstelensis]
METKRYGACSSGSVTNIIHDFFLECADQKGYHHSGNLFSGAERSSSV